MPQDDSLDSVSVQPARGPFTLYASTVAILAGVLASEFLVAYNLLRDHPTHAPSLTLEVYGMFAAGLVILVAQAALVYNFLLRPLREATLRALHLARALDERSHRDVLTGTLNRTAFDQMIVRELDALKRYAVSFCGIMLDVDGFRPLNERLGYEQGDHTLHDLALLLKQHMRKADFIFRWRSGRFLILASGIDPAHAQRFAEKLRDLVAGHDFGHGVRLTVCMGVAPALPDDSAELFVARVKNALGQAKNAGPSTVFQVPTVD